MVIKIRGGLGISVVGGSNVHSLLGKCHPTVFPPALPFMELTISFLTLCVILVIQIRGKKWDVLCQRTAKNTQDELHGQ